MSFMTRQGIAVSLLTSTFVFSLIAEPAARQSVASTARDPHVAALPGYQVSVFAAGTTAYLHPDSLLVYGQHVYVGYQNLTAKDGSDHKSSTVVEYTLQGKALRTFSVLGHNDGLRFNPTTHMLWALTDEDANPRLTTINLMTGATTLYRFPPTPHGGGFDDMAFLHGVAFMDASNPTLTRAGINVFPALDTAVLQGRAVVLTPVLMGHVPALDATTHHKVLLNEVDPDSLVIDPHGDLVMDNQAGAELVFLHNPGTAHQMVTRVPLGTQVDDTVWAATAQGRLLIADTKADAIYAVRTTFVPGTVYTAAPDDSGVARFVGTLDVRTGAITPVIIGLSGPHGLAFVPDAHG